MAREPKTPRTRATRNRPIKNWHVWLLIWVLVMVAAAGGSYWILGPGSKVSPADLAQIGEAAAPRATEDSSPAPTPAPVETESPKPSPTPSPSETVVWLDKGARVVIYNNTATRGYAARTADRAKALGWNVVAVENWRGSVPSSTVFYSQGFANEAKAFAKDLGIGRIAPNHSGISLKGLSVVLRS